MIYLYMGGGLTYISGCYVFRNQELDNIGMLVKKKEPKSKSPNCNI